LLAGRTLPREEEYVAPPRPGIRLCFRFSLRRSAPAALGMAMLPAAFRRWSAPLREGARYYPAAASVSSSRLCRLALGIVFFAFALG